MIFPPGVFIGGALVLKIMVLEKTRAAREGEHVSDYVQDLPQQQNYGGK